MADKQPTNAEPKEPEGEPKNDPKQEPTGKQPEAKPNGGDDLAKVAKENENLRGTLSTLQKKYNEVSGFVDTLKSALGVEKPKEGENEMEILKSTVTSLQKELSTSKAQNILNETIDNYQTEEGEQLPDNVKSYLREELVVEDPDRDKIAEMVTSKAKKVISLFGENGKFTNVDKRPEPSSLAGFSAQGANANEILESMKKN